MIAFKLSVNGEYICTPGVRDFGVLSAIITWVRRKPQSGRGGKTIEEELTADLDGLDSESKEHLKWWSQRLRVGDRLSIEVVETKRADKPKRRYRDNPKVVERAKRRYFERLKKELGASSKGGRRTSRCRRCGQSVARLTARATRISMSMSAKLIFLCGKMAAGKSTFANDLAQRENAVLLVQDEFLDHLFPGEIIDIPGFLKRSSRLRNALGPHVCVLLSCKSQLKDRSKGLPPGTPWTSEAEFEAITVYFQPPSEDERFNVIRHERA